MQLGHKMGHSPRIMPSTSPEGSKALGLLARVDRRRNHFSGIRMIQRRLGHRSGATQVHLGRTYVSKLRIEIDRALKSD